MKKILIRLIPIFLFLGGFIIYDMMNWGEQSDADQRYFENLNLSLSGKISDIIPLNYGHDYGIITVDLKNCNTKYYDGRNSKQFIGIIKDGQAKLIVMNESEIQKNDSIFINISDFQIKRENKILNKKYILGLPPTTTLNNPWSEIKDKLSD